MLLDFARQIQLESLMFTDHFHGIVDRRQPVFRVLRVERRADDLRDLANILCDGCHLAVFPRMTSLSDD